MSHAATKWAVEQRGISPAAKVVLWHLADRYHPEHGCFPTQSRLAYDCEISRRSLNNQLKNLEEAGLIRRYQRVDEGTKRQRPTRYFLAFEDGFNSPESNGQTQDIVPPCAKSAHGSRVQNPAKPCANSGKSRVQNLHTNPVRGTSKITSKRVVSGEIDPLPPQNVDCQGADEIDLAFSAYNVSAGVQGWPLIAKRTKARVAALRQRLRDCGGLEGWRAALSRAGASSFCNGGNDRGWRCNIDFLLQESSFTKLMEGFYDDREQSTGHPPRNRRRDEFEAALARRQNRSD